MSAIRRITREYEQFKKEKKEYEQFKKENSESNWKDSTLRYIEIVQPKSGDYFTWEAYLTAPEDSVYKGGVFKLLISVSSEYPFKPPKVIFKPAIYHPNVNSAGVICIDILGKEWSPAFTLNSILLSLLTLLDDPNADDPLAPEIADMYKTNKEEYILRCQESARKAVESNKQESAQKAIESKKQESSLKIIESKK
ncbi:ubiquitin-conjugating enzyme [Ordospora pajunii]|uniref:ubiquitin-conjugating enzyme n=1 Tax=Ordospora pajunii TaxID=3039483 RepID=UPI0029528D9F|nr:ubiquitin-conjugating enzyme [Ordospora pajunii]KAH9410729.1 ubiquitin-conjugating enzyme [Ordospora pajunii]